MENIWGIIGASLLTFSVLGVIFLAALVRLWREPPELKFVINTDTVVTLPDNVKVQLQRIPATVETDKPTEEPIPEDILTYIEQESDTWAQEARRRRARMLKGETGSWDAAFRMLQNEDSR